MTSLLPPSIPIYTDPYLGKTVTPEPPALKPGPYHQRRIRRWRKKHPPYTVGDGTIYFINGGRAILCHPDDLPKLRQQLAAKGLL